jgi:hypothetical protein
LKKEWIQKRGNPPDEGIFDLLTEGHVLFFDETLQREWIDMGMFQCPTLTRMELG